MMCYTRVDASNFKGRSSPTCVTARSGRDKMSILRGVLGEPQR